MQKKQDTFFLCIYLILCQIDTESNYWTITLTQLHSTLVELHIASQIAVLALCI